MEDIYEAIVNTVPQMKFGVAFNEASGPCLTRVDGNDDGLKAMAARNATALAAGHIFVVVMRDGYPINVLGRIKDVPEVCSIFCATANPVQAVVAESEQGRGVLGVIDGFPPKGVETPEDAEKRRECCTSTSIGTSDNYLYRAATEDLLSEPTQADVRAMEGIEGDLMILGVGGKMGPSLARRARRACELVGVKKRIIGVARFSEPGVRDCLEAAGIETASGPARAGRTGELPIHQT